MTIAQLCALALTDNITLRDEILFQLLSNSSSPASNIPTNAETGEVIWSEDTNDLNYAAFQTWKAANTQTKVLSITNLTGNDGVTSLLVTYLIP